MRPELGNDAAALGEVGELLDLQDHLAQQTLAHFGDLEVRDRGLGEADRMSDRHVRPDRDGS
jgi:hypothetical protein